jgi:hypothetical protein
MSLVPLRRALLPALLGSLAFAVAAQAIVLPGKVEQKCAKKLGKLGAKLGATMAKETSSCRIADIEGKAPGSCPNAGNLAKINAIADKLTATAESSCKSVCSVSQSIECIADALCPPLIGGSNEACSAGAANLPFDMSRINFPGPYCELLLAGPIVEPAQIADCVREASTIANDALAGALYGTITNASSVSPNAVKCLSAASKSVLKLAKVTTKGAGKCRNSINSGKLVADPRFCASADPKIASKIATAQQKVRDAVASACSVSDLAELDLCGLGVGALTVVADAGDCLAAVGREAGDSSDVPVQRLSIPISFTEAAYPPRAVCGDHVANQLPNPFLLLGEECDASDDAACPGACLPPGDVFECTCGDRPRMRAFSNAILTDSDAGWTGTSHDQLTADQSGFIVDLANCDCDGFTGADCTGGSVDSVCDVSGTQRPFCSWDTTKSIRCDDVGNGDNRDRDADCSICDSYALNAGASCVNSTGCQSQCYDSLGVPTGPCVSQANCGTGEVCRGRCDTTQTCIITANGGPLPVAAAGAAVCNVQKFRTSITGTRDLETAENEHWFQVYSITHLGERTSRPCPVCGGFCVGGAKDLEVCAGRCEGGGDPCRFDEDCPGIDAKCGDSSPDCPGGFCQLQLICGTEPGSNDAVAGAPCRIEHESPYFGTLSSDCQPAAGRNIGGEGFLVKHEPTGSELKTLPFAIPCTASGFELFDCPCPDDGGEPTKPNNCTPACDATGPSFGVGCANGNSGGAATRCASGVNANRLCDEDSDCPGSSCSLNPKHCSGDPAFARFSCTTNADCGLGVCGDACPGGRCVPLCMPEIGDPEDGVCAAGPPVYTCQHPAYGFVTCTKASAEAGCAATCSGAATPCESSSECPSGETCQGSCEHARDCEAGIDGVLGTADDFVGAGPCVGKPRGCNLDPIAVEGGDVFNGLGDNTNYLRTSIWCFTRTLNAGINSASGFGGPGVIRERGVNVVNVGSIP